MISRKSITDTFGKRCTRSCWKRARASTVAGPFSGATYVCGACSNGPGRNTNMKPPLRDSRHSTFRTLDTRALNVRPSTSNFIVSPTLMANRSWMPFSIETSGSCDGPVQNLPSVTRSFGSR